MVENSNYEREVHGCTSYLYIHYLVECNSVALVTQVLINCLRYYLRRPETEVDSY